MFRAISFGVFWRLAPSTRAIMRSRNVSPGFEVMRTTMRSDSTRVPPVTALRSPPDSRITGADSPVMADSSTDAMPSTTSPSPGMTWPASTTHRSPTWGGFGWETTGVEPSADMGALLELADQVLDDGAERDDGEVGEADDDDHHRREQAGEERCAGRERARRRRDGLLACERAGDRQSRDHAEEAPDQHRDGL